MTPAMTRINMFFVGSLRALTQDVSRQLFEQVRYGGVHVFIACLNLYRVSPTRHKCISFTPSFTTVSGQVSSLLGELERRARVHPDERGSLLSECHAAYFSAHKNLLIPCLTLSRAADLILQE